MHILLIPLISFGALACCAALAWFLFATPGSLGFKILAAASVTAGIPAFQRFITTTGNDWIYLLWMLGCGVSAAIWFAAWEASKGLPPRNGKAERDRQKAS